MGNREINLEIDKDTRILAEVKKLNSTLGKLDKKSKKSVQALIKNAAFMAITLEDLQNKINEDGPVSEYQNGENQWGTKKSPEVDIYNTMIKNYSSVMKQLTDLLPKQTSNEDDGFDDFVNNK